MRALIIILAVEVAISVGYIGGNEENNPFEWSLQPEVFIHKLETISGIKTVMQWRRDVMQDAQTPGNDLPVMGLYPCKPAHKQTFICDYRNRRK